MPGVLQATCNWRNVKEPSDGLTPRDVLTVGKSFEGTQEFECECTAFVDGKNVTASQIHEFTVISELYHIK